MKKKLLDLNILHILNDGFEASLLLLIPFITKELHITLTQVGVLGTLANAFSILLGIPAGYLAVKFGGTRILFFGLIIYVLGFIGTGISPSFLALAVAFGLGGIGFGIFHPIAFALVARSTDKKDRGTVMGNFTALGDIGKVLISGVVTFIIAIIGWRFTAFSYASLGIIMFLGLLIIKRKITIDQTEEKKKATLSMASILKSRKFLFASATNTFDSFASTSLYVFLPFLFLKKGINPILLGSFTAAFFIGNFLGKTLLGKFVDRFGNTKVFIAAELLMALCILLLANTSYVFIIITASILLGVFTKGTVPVIQTMVSEAAEDHGNFEKVFGINAMVVSVGTTFSPLLLGVLSDKFGIIASFNTMALFAILAIIPALAFHQERKKNSILAVAK